MSQTDDWPSRSRLRLLLLHRLRGVIVLQFPPLSLLVRITLLHNGLVLGCINGETLLRRPVSDLVGLLVVRPELIALGSVAWEEHNVASGIVQAGLIPPDLAFSAQHPELQGTHMGKASISTCDSIKAPNANRCRSIGRKKLRRINT